MNAEMKEAEKHLTGMEKWCGLCICPWNRRPKVRDVDGTWQSSSKVVTKYFDPLKQFNLNKDFKVGSNKGFLIIS